MNANCPTRRHSNPIEIEDFILFVCCLFAATTCCFVRSRMIDASVLVTFVVLLLPMARDRINGLQYFRR